MVLMQAPVNSNLSHSSPACLRTQDSLSGHSAFSKVCDPFHAILVDSGNLEEDAMILEAQDVSWVNELIGANVAGVIIPGDPNFIPGVGGSPNEQEPEEIQHVDPSGGELYVDGWIVDASHRHSLRRIPSGRSKCQRSLVNGRFICVGAADRDHHIGERCGVQHHGKCVGCGSLGDAGDAGRFGDGEPGHIVVGGRDRDGLIRQWVKKAV